MHLPSAQGSRRRGVMPGFAAFFVLLAGSASPQQLSVSRLTPIDTPTVFYFHSHVVDCQGVTNYRLATPAIVVFPERPTHGVVSSREGVAPVQRCHGQLGRATIVTYVPERGFSGVDNFQMRVLFDLKERTVSKQFNVRVQVGGPGNPN